MNQTHHLAMEKSWHYHTMRNHKGITIWDGQYDLYPLWDHFGIPDNLKNQSVIDIGTASGFFAFECEKRGAFPVVGTELTNISSWDSRCHVHYDGVDIPKENQRDFWKLHRLFNSRVHLVYGSINQPLHQILGLFDWVIFGSLMTHLMNPMLALKNIFNLTKKRAVVISSYLPKDNSKSLHWITTSRPFDWWVPSKLLVPDMLRSVGFRHIKETGDFILVHADGSTHHQACWHAFV